MPEPRIWDWSSSRLDVTPSVLQSRLPIDDDRERRRTLKNWCGDEEALASARTLHSLWMPGTRKSFVGVPTAAASTVTAITAPPE
jgi:hypothetical protein